MNRIVRADHEISADRGELLRRRLHQTTYRFPVAAINWRHVLRKREGVHRHFGMPMPADQLRAFDANREVTERGALGGARDDSDVLRHRLLWETPGEYIPRACSTRNSGRLT